MRWPVFSDRPKLHAPCAWFDKMGLGEELRKILPKPPMFVFCLISSRGDSELEQLFAELKRRMNKRFPESK